MPDVVNVLIRVIVPKAGVGAHLDLPQAAARLPWKPLPLISRDHVKRGTHKLGFG